MPRSRSQWLRDRRSPPTVAGAATAWEESTSAPRSRFTPVARGTNVVATRRGSSVALQSPALVLSRGFLAAILMLAATAAVGAQARGSSAATPETRPQQVVSLNLCADQLLV